MAAVHWAFTSFKAESPVYDEKTMRYLVYQRERCPKTGNEHWQGYVQVAKKARMKAVQTILGDEKCHMEMAKGSPEQNKNYCTKEDSRMEGPFEFGVMSGKGTRTDLQTAGKLACEGKWEEIPDTTLVRYARGLEKLVVIRNKPKVREMECTILWGPTGTGKSHTANEMLPNAFWKPAGSWWDGYKGEKEVVIDEFDPEKHNVNDVLRWMDKWPLSVPIKGGFVPYNVERLVITSHFDPENWYGERRAEIRRRAKIILLCTLYTGPSPSSASRSPPA